jgi:cobalt-zinc-cadmium efflux system outer membrane protein
MIRAVKIFILFFFIPGLWAHAQQMDLKSVLQEIKNNNPNQKVFDERIQAADADVNGLSGWEAPQVGASLWMMPYNFSHDGYLVLSAEQMFKNPKKIRARKSLMQGMSDVDKSEKEVSLNELFFKAKSSYYEWIILAKRYTLLDGTENLMQFVSKAAELRYSYGKEKLSNIYKSKLDLLELSNKKINILNQINSKKIELNTLMNRDPDSDLEIDTTYMPLSREAEKIDTAYMKGRRNDLGMIEKQMKLADLSKKVELSNSYPDFGFKYEHMNSLAGFPNAFSLMGTVSIPIVPWASKEYKARIVYYEHSINALQQQKSALMNEAVSSARSLSASISSINVELKTYVKKIIPAAEDYYKTSMQAYEENTESLEAVMMALGKWQEVNIDYLEKLGELFQMQAAYEKELEIK